MGGCGRSGLYNTLIRPTVTYAYETWVFKGDGFTSLPKEGVLRIFPPLKI
jgi:hypothetical protein